MISFPARNILWVNVSGAYVHGLAAAAPIRAVACLDDGLDLDLVTARHGTRFLSAERAFSGLSASI